MSDGFSSRQFTLGAFDIDVDPLVIASGIGEPFNLILSDLCPAAYTDLAPDRAFEVVEVIEDAHGLLRCGNSRRKQRERISDVQAAARTATYEPGASSSG